MVIQAGAMPVFADCDADTFNIDPQDVERKISDYTNAIIPVSLYGLAVDLDPLVDLGHERDIAIIEDNAQYFLGTYKERLVGTIGDAASFSLQDSKHMTSGNDGGMVLTNDENLARGIRKAATLGYSTLDARPGSTMIPRDERQDWDFKHHDRMGYNFRMSAMQAALGLGQLERLDDLVATRRYIAWSYESVIRKENCEWLIPPHVPEGCSHTYWCYTCKLDEGLLGSDWREFRRTFIEHGGDGRCGPSTWSRYSST